MTLPRGVSGKETVDALKHAGWQRARTRGSHAIMVHPRRPGNVPVPLHDELGRGLLRKIIRDAGMTVEEFVQHLQKQRP